MIYTESRRVGHAATETAWAESTSLARESQNSAVPTVLASDAKKAMGRNAATKVSLELVKHEGGQFAASGFQIRQERRQVILYRSVKQGRFGAMTLVRGRARGRVGVTACSWLRGKHQQELSATGRNQLLAERRIQSNLWPGVSPGLDSTIARYSPFRLYFAPAFKSPEKKPFTRSSAQSGTRLRQPGRRQPGSVARPAREAWRSHGL